MGGLTPAQVSLVSRGGSRRTSRGREVGGGQVCAAGCSRGFAAHFSPVRALSRSSARRAIVRPRCRGCSVSLLLSKIVG
jgi:hypothetical protein